MWHAEPDGTPDQSALVLGVSESTKDTILVLNKIDRVEPERLLALKERYPMAVCVSARDGSGLDGLTGNFKSRVHDSRSRAPIADGASTPT